MRAAHFLYHGTRTIIEAGRTSQPACRGIRGPVNGIAVTSLGV
ncbi:MAG: hypothetical protein V5A43_04285 [Haloarculaceae archaeon]